jgi:DNA-binding transcriptional ArsR family regulator
MLDVFKALADPTRRKLLDRLKADNGQTLSELCQHLDMTRQAVTKHLRLLEGANLVVIVWRGREKLHYLNPVPIQEVYERWIGQYERRRLRALHDLKQALEGKIRKVEKTAQGERTDGQAKIRVRNLHHDDSGKIVERTSR